MKRFAPCYCRVAEPGDNRGTQSFNKGRGRPGLGRARFGMEDGLQRAELDVCGQ